MVGPDARHILVNWEISCGIMYTKAYRKFSLHHILELDYGENLEGFDRIITRPFILHRTTNGIWDKLRD